MIPEATRRLEASFTDSALVPHLSGVDSFEVQPELALLRELLPTRFTLVVSPAHVDGGGMRPQVV